MILVILQYKVAIKNDNILGTYYDFNDIFFPSNLNCLHLKDRSKYPTILDILICSVCA